ncbi:MAG: hypothetical protein PHE68_02375 [Candidatus Peribacteraceae bacterium]|nr:hypothetical protein [Candidatus Peribacteraceae bacterium]MDD5074594.1 hypothetical protein [Candidatus Peribacteraceae bacterium]
MTELHPNWDATDKGEEIIPVHAAAADEPLPEPPHVTSMSRQPAAVAGILISISIGFALYLGIGPSANGGVASGTTVHITASGFTPAQISVTQGEEITWINDVQSAQALQSDELCTTARQCFATSLFAPGSAAGLVITPDFMPGTYRYYSITTQGMEGSITVIASKKPLRDSTARHQANLENALPVEDSSASAGAASSDSVPSAASSMESSLPSADPDPVALPPESSSSDESSSSEESEPTVIPSSDSSSSEYIAAEPAASSAASSVRSASPSATIPVNPYTVGSPRGSNNSMGTASTGKEALHGGAPRPIAQPETGPTIWIAIALAVSALFVLTQRSLMKKPS